MRKEHDKIAYILENYTPDEEVLSFVKENYQTMKRTELSRKLGLPKFLVNRLVEVVKE